ncbi:hypothetical protein LQ327_00210 [Actinomycetospora endophytica]|uniref:Uncharacterized protein n=1 Tax=Actinomycetospora endophytica TaxID=2291215 RepID=A0ABS8P432_9PSEU|nr:hypothetical protein [Actinomycetospora endophytica]MCD2191814.1 hypothetical protein [Actinomycetospora endophytica]
MRRSTDPGREHRRRHRRQPLGVVLALPRPFHRDVAQTRPAQLQAAAPTQPVGHHRWIDALDVDDRFVRPAANGLPSARYGQQVRDAMRTEWTNGVEAHFDEGAAGAGRFADGRGRHGDFAAI